jgi:hypothetical protein
MMGKGVSGKGSEMTTGQSHIIACGRVPHKRIFSFSSRMSQRAGPGTVEAVFSRRSVEIQFRPGLFP